MVLECFNTKICFHSTMNNKKLLTSSITKVTHCIFDLDGTLLDTENMYHDIIREVCLRYERCYTKQFEVLMCGKPDSQVFETVHRELRIPTPLTEFVDLLAWSTKDQLVKAPIMLGADRLVRHLHKHNVPLAIATNSELELLDRHLKAKPGFFRMFGHWVTINDPEVTEGKPSPQMYLLAAKRFDDNLEPRKCLVFEDSPTGLKAGIAAGMQVVFVPYGDSLMDDEKLIRKATVVLQSMNDFKPEMFGLPPYSANSELSLK